MTLSPKHSMWLDYISGTIASAGLFMFLHHITFYAVNEIGGPAWHWAFLDHGLYGFVMLVASVSVLIWRHKPQRGGKK